MAGKEAAVYIIDLGSSMADCNNGRTESDLDFSMRYVWDRIAATVQTSRKTLYIGVVGLRTDETKNELADKGNDGYENIEVIRELAAMSMTEMRELKEFIKPNDTMSGDAVSAIIVATEMIVEFTRDLKYDRKIFLVTDGQGIIDGDSLGEIASRLNEKHIQLTVIGVDFDDPEYGFKEEDKTQLKAINESFLNSLVSKCDGGVLGTMAQAVEELVIPRIKPIRLVKNFDGPLTLGDPERYESAFVINVERYPKTKIARPAAASTVVIKLEPDGSQSTQTLGSAEMEGVQYGDGAFSSVKNTRTYKVNDPGAPGGKKDVDFESLVKGYAYGSTAVPISEHDWSITKLDTKKSFSILGFVPNSKYEPFLSMGETFVTIARKFDEKSELALSALIHALYELDSYAVARFVAKDDKDPALLLLMPSIEPDLECLYDIPLPFAEDVRSYQFPPLDKVITITGNTITSNHRFLPDDDLNDAMSDFVDAMDISTYERDEEGNPAEWAAIDDSYSPTIHRVEQAIRARATYSNDAIEGIPPALVKFSRPPGDLVAKAKLEIDSLIDAAKVLKVPEKAKAKPNSSEEKAQTLSQKPIADLYPAREKRRTISKDNAIPDFKNWLSNTGEQPEKEIDDAVKQMGQIIRSLVEQSFGDNQYDRAIENLGVMRQQLIVYEFPWVYNNFLRDFKKRLLAGELGGDRRDFWAKIKWNKGVHLIHQRVSEVSDITEEEAADFFRKKP